MFEIYIHKVDYCYVFSTGLESFSLQNTASTEASAGAAAEEKGELRHLIL